MKEDVAQPTQKSRPQKRAGGYLFIPRALQRSDVILWLRRTHAWTGFYGAIFFFCLGLSGFYLNHRTSTLHIEGGTTREVASLSVIVEAGLLNTADDLAAWMQKEYSIGAKPSPQRSKPAEPVTFQGRESQQPETLSVSFRGPNAVITGEHVVGSNVVELKRTNSSFIKALTNLHKGVGAGMIWILLVDTIAGALVFMSLSGVLLWTRLHGPRLAALGIMGALVVMASFAMSGGWVAWTAP